MGASDGVRGRIYDGSVVVYLNDGHRWDLGPNGKSEVTIYPGHEPRLTEAEWREQQRPQVEVIERARSARHTYLQAKPGSPEQQEAGRELAAVSSDLIAAVEAAPEPQERLVAVYSRDLIGEIAFLERYRDTLKDMPDAVISSLDAAEQIDAVIRRIRKAADNAPQADARTPLPPEKLEALEQAVYDDCGSLNLRTTAARDEHRRDVIRAALPHLRADEVMTREEWRADYLRDLREAWPLAAGRAKTSVRLALRKDGFAVVKSCADDAGYLALGHDDPVDALRAVAAAPCPCESAEWRDESWVWGIGCPPQRRYRPGDTCPDCGKPLPLAPQKPVEDMSAEECEAEKPDAVVAALALADALEDNDWESPMVIDTSLSKAWAGVLRGVAALQIPPTPSDAEVRRLKSKCSILYGQREYMRKKLTSGMPRESLKRLSKKVIEWKSWVREDLDSEEMYYRGQSVVKAACEVLGVLGIHRDPEEDAIAAAELPPAPQKPAEDMSAEECEAELDAADGVEWLSYRDGKRHCVLVVKDGDRLTFPYDDEREAALRTAVTVLRQEDCRTTTDA